MNLKRLFGIGVVKEHPQEPITPFVFKPMPPDPKMVRLTVSIIEALEKDSKGKEFCDVELIHRFRDELKASEEDVIVALSDLVNHGKLTASKVCFLRVNTIRVPE